MRLPEISVARSVRPQRAAYRILEQVIEKSFWSELLHLNNGKIITPQGKTAAVKWVKQGRSPAHGAAATSYTNHARALHFPTRDEGAVG